MRSGDVAIAYQVVGEGPVDLVFVPFFGNIRYAWEQPLFARFLERLASFSRLIVFDKRGTGLSDRPRVLTLETQMDDSVARVHSRASPGRSRSTSRVPRDAIRPQARCGRAATPRRGSVLIAAL